jgi:hypothetical protein
MAIFVSDPPDSNLVASTWERLTISPSATVLILIALTCLFTRVRTGIQNKKQSASKAEPKEIALLPYWLPWLGHAIPFATRFQNFLADARLLSSPDRIPWLNYADQEPAKPPGMESSTSSLQAQSTTLPSLRV